MIIVYTAISIPFSAFVMRNFFTGVAHNVFEAAVLDGASTWRIFARVYLPMASSALVAIFILQATFIWNDLLLGLTLQPVRRGAADRDHASPACRARTAARRCRPCSPAASSSRCRRSILFLFTQKFFARGLALGQY